MVFSVDFASYGSPEGQCDTDGYFELNDECHSGVSRSRLQHKCIGKQKCEVPVSNAEFGIVIMTVGFHHADTSCKATHVLVL